MSGLFDNETARDGMTVIKCLSLWEPWATLMAIGAKTMETRSWPTSYRGPLLICASKRRGPELLEAMQVPEIRGAFRRAVQPMTVGAFIESLPFGMAVAVVDLVRCVPTDTIGATGEAAFGDYSPGRFAWVTNNLRRLAPFQITGHQGLWNEAIATDRLAAIDAKDSPR